MSVLIAGSAIRTCIGDGAATFAALVRGECGVGPTRRFDPGRLHLPAGYYIADVEHETWLHASRSLAACVRDALAQSGVDPERERVVAVVGTGLGELRAVERSADTPMPVPTESLHFAGAVRDVSPHIRDVITLSNACSAGGHALAVAQDLVELGEADAVIAAGTDSMTESMLAMIARFATSETERVRPFDRHRTGVLLGDGAAAQVIVAEGRVRRPMARVLATGLSCDAHHETAPDVAGIWRAVDDAFHRSHRLPVDVDLVVTHGTGTALNDPTEATMLSELFGQLEPGPWMTGVKGAVGHTSGAAALVNVDVAIRCFTNGVIPPVVGLNDPIDEASRIRLVTQRPIWKRSRLAHLNAFGFGGVNAVTLIEATQ